VPKLSLRFDAIPENTFRASGADSLGTGSKEVLFSAARLSEKPHRLHDSQDSAADFVSLRLALIVAANRGYTSVKSVYSDNYRQI
jgi:hypothetical protein